MPTCFVIQPFDGAKYEKRYTDIFKPAILATKLTPYRTDHDPSVDVPIDAIEEGIRGAAVCLADISTDNPNVWYELGYASAAKCPVVMVCSDERGKRYPFDIQHRSVIRYVSESTSDFEKLKLAIQMRIEAVLSKANALTAISNSEQIAPVEGLTQPELAVLASVAGSAAIPGESVSAWSAKQEVEKAGFTPVAFSIGLHRLSRKNFVEVGEGLDRQFGEEYPAITITEVGWQWIERNESRFVLHRPPLSSGNVSDDIPF